MDGFNNFKRAVFALALFLFLIFVPLISAVQIEMNENYSSGETLIAKITGNFIDIPSANNIFLYKDWHIPSPAEFHVSKIKNDYYAYAVLTGKSAGNYSLKIKDVRYYQVNTIIDEDIVKNFTIENSTADFYVIPGFLETDKDFSLKLTSLKDSDVLVKINSKASDSGSDFFDSLFGGGSSDENSESNITLSPGESKNITLKLDRNITEPTLEKINLSSENTFYSVPVYMVVENTTKDIGTGNLRFSSVILNVSLATNSNTTRILYLENLGNDSIENISVYVSGPLSQYVNISAKNIDKISKNSSMRIDLVFISESSEKSLEGQITARYLNESDSSYEYEYAAVFLNFVKDYVPPEGSNESIPTETKTCSQLEGEICSGTQTCSGESVYALDNLCCLDSCSSEGQKSTSYGKWFGWGLLGLVIIFLSWFFLKKFRRVSTPVNLIKIAKGK